MSLRNIILPKGTEVILIRSINLGMSENRFYKGERVLITGSSRDRASDEVWHNIMSIDTKRFSRGIILGLHVMPENPYVKLFYLDKNSIHSDSTEDS